MSKNVAAVQTISSSLNQDYQKLLGDYLPSIILHILPFFALEKSSTSVDGKLKSKIAEVTACYDILLQHVPETVKLRICTQ